MTHYQTRHGYTNDEVVSALQKDVRRGNERLANEGDVEDEYRREAQELPRQRTKKKEG